MPDYEKLYGYLFNCITDALAELEAGRAEAARAVLISAQMSAEQRRCTSRKTAANNLFHIDKHAGL